MKREKDRVYHVVLVLVLLVMWCLPGFGMLAAAILR
jgi:hypothetical protein